MGDERIDTVISHIDMGFLVTLTKAGPEVQAILADPDMQQVFDDMISNPAAATVHLKNPVVLAKLQKMFGSGII